jgi:hypothetical protein
MLSFARCISGAALTAFVIATPIILAAQAPAAQEAVGLTDS